jgi:hypothetical protein
MARRPTTSDPSEKVTVVRGHPAHACSRRAPPGDACAHLSEIPESPSLRISGQTVDGSLTRPSRCDDDASAAGSRPRRMWSTHAQPRAMPRHSYPRASSEDVARIHSECRERDNDCPARGFPLRGRAAQGAGQGSHQRISESRMGTVCYGAPRLLARNAPRWPARANPTQTSARPCSTGGSRSSSLPIAGARKHRRSAPL